MALGLTKGAVRLERYLEQTYEDVATKGKAIKLLARKIGVSPHTLAKWLIGERRPRPEYQIKIQRLTEITADDWIRSIR